MISEHPVGPVTKHIKQSTGGEANLMNHYCTTSEYTYGRGFQHFEPRTGCHRGAGYVPNNRPFIAYRSSLDLVDNPPIGELIKSNYKTITKKDYNRYCLPNGNEKLPEFTFYSPTGFVREKGTHIPTDVELQSQFLCHKMKRLPANIGPKKVPTLHKIRPKDPVELENHGYGPQCMSTEYKTRYLGDQFPENGPGHVGNREDTGFTDNIKIEDPTEGRPDACACPIGQCCKTRPIGQTIYHTDYWPLCLPNGREPLPNIDTHAAVDNGFTKGNKALPDFVVVHPEKVYDRAGDMTGSRIAWIKKNDPAEYMNAIYDGREPTITKGTYQGKQINPFEDQHYKVGVGCKENTGQVSNERPFVNTRDNLERFITSYNTKFYDPTLIGDERNGHVNFEIQKLQTDGFSRDTKIHQIEPQLDAFVSSSRFSPYQSRSVFVRESVTTAPTKLLA